MFNVDSEESEFISPSLSLEYEGPQDLDEGNMIQVLRGHGQPPCCGEKAEFESGPDKITESRAPSELPHPPFA